MKAIEENARSLFEVTAPYLRVPPGIAYLPAHLDGLGVVEDGRERRRPLNGQEFFLFRGITDPEDVDWFAKEYGRLGLSDVARELSPEPNIRPTCAKALTLDPVKYRRNAEPAADWIRQAGLMDMALGLHGIYADAAARRAFTSACRRLGAASPAEKIDEQLEAAQTRSSWAVRSIMRGAAMSGLAVSTGGMRQTSGATPQRYVTFEPVGWRPIRAHGRVVGQSMRLELSKSEIAEFLLRLLRPWVERTGPSLTVEEGHITPASRGPNDLLGNLWLQFANGLLSSVEPRLCAWERCPGPPQRPGVFIFQWGGGGPGSKHRDSLYCHPNCRRAAVVARTRESPARQRQRSQRQRSQR